MSQTSVAVLSDGHLGDWNSWLETEAVQGAVVRALAERPAIATLVLLGDTLDLNFGTLTTAIEGRLQGSARRPGLRALLASICRHTNIGQIVYLPGNHDYPIWDWEARQRNVLTPLSQGERLHGGALCHGAFDNPFLAGVMPQASRARLSLVFPHLTMNVGNHRVVFTHGHYLDQIQTGGVALRAVLKARDPDSFLHRLAIASAQYQTFAYALAIRRSTRREVHQWYDRLTAVYDWVGDTYARLRGLRQHPMSCKVLLTIEAYARYVAKDAALSAFVFGHTHVPGKWTTGGNPRLGWPPIRVYNSGSFVPPRGRDRFSSMLLLGPGQDGVVVDLLKLTPSGEASVVRLSSGA